MFKHAAVVLVFRFFGLPSLLLDHVRVDNREDIVVVTRLNEGSNALCHDVERVNIIALPVNVLSSLVVARSEVLTEKGQKSLISQALEEGMCNERLLVTVDRYGITQLWWQGFNELSKT